MHCNAIMQQCDITALQTAATSASARNKVARAFGVRGIAAVRVPRVNTDARTHTRKHARTVQYSTSTVLEYTRTHRQAHTQGIFTAGERARKLLLLCLLL